MFGREIVKHCLINISCQKSSTAKRNAINVSELLTLLVSRLSLYAFLCRSVYKVNEEKNEMNIIEREGTKYWSTDIRLHFKQTSRYCV